MTKCAICRHGEIQAGHTTVTLERGRMVMVVRRVPGQVCTSCGEPYVSDEVTAQLTQDYPMNIKADSVTVTDTGVQRRFSTENARLPKGEQDPCFAGL